MQRRDEHPRSGGNLWVSRWSLEAPFPLRRETFVCGGDEDRRWWKLEIRPREIQRLERGLGFRVGDRGLGKT